MLHLRERSAECGQPKAGIVHVYFVLGALGQVESKGEVNDFTHNLTWPAVSKETDSVIMCGQWSARGLVLSSDSVAAVIEGTSVRSECEVSVSMVSGQRGDWC